MLSIIVCQHSRQMSNLAILFHIYILNSAFMLRFISWVFKQLKELLVKKKNQVHVHVCAHTLVPIVSFFAATHLKSLNYTHSLFTSLLSNSFLDPGRPVSLSIM